MTDSGDIEQKILDHANREGSIPVIADRESAEILREWVNKPEVGGHTVIDINLKAAEQEKARQTVIEANKRSWEDKGVEIGRRYSRWLHTEEGKKQAEENLRILNEADDMGRGFVDRMILSKKLKGMEIEAFLTGVENDERSISMYPGGDRINSGLNKLGMGVEERNKLLKDLADWRWALKLESDMKNGRDDAAVHLALTTDRDPRISISLAETRARTEGIKKGWQELMVKSGDEKQQN